MNHLYSISIYYYWILWYLLFFSIHFNHWINFSNWNFISSNWLFNYLWFVWSDYSSISIYFFFSVILLNQFERLYYKIYLFMNMLVFFKKNLSNTSFLTNCLFLTILENFYWNLQNEFPKIFSFRRKTQTKHQNVLYIT